MINYVNFIDPIFQEKLLDATWIRNLGLISEIIYTINIKIISVIMNDIRFIYNISFIYIYFNLWFNEKN